MLRLLAPLWPSLPPATPMNNPSPIPTSAYSQSKPPGFASATPATKEHVHRARRAPGDAMIPSSSSQHGALHTHQGEQAATIRPGEMPSPPLNRPVRTSSGGRGHILDKDVHVLALGRDDSSKSKQEECGYGHGDLPC